MTHTVVKHQKHSVMHVEREGENKRKEVDRGLRKWRGWDTRVCCLSFWEMEHRTQSMNRHSRSFPAKNGRTQEN